MNIKNIKCRKKMRESRFLKNKNHYYISIYYSHLGIFYEYTLREDFFKKGF